MSASSNSRKIKVLTVGDGNLSLSLSLSRAYNEQIDLTASVLESDRRNFLSVFSEAEDTLEELKNRHVPVVWNLDATQLHVRIPSSTTTKWDLISFHHPHIGLSNFLEEDVDDEAKRALVHHRLICHYLYSASQVSKLVHICLTHTQPTTWKLFEAAERQNLTLVKTISDSKPFANVWSDNNEDVADCDSNSNNTTMTTGLTTGSGNISEAAKIESHFAAPRRYRNGKLSCHFLGKYGYQHRRTEGDTFKGSSNTKDVSVSGSIHFVFAAKDSKKQEASRIDDTDITKSNSAGKSNTLGNDDKKMICSICNEILDSEIELKEHLALPPDHETPSGGTVLIVPKDHHGKRLRWFLHHSKTKEYQFTKRLVESAIQAGLVMINGTIVLDSSRILNAQDKVCIVVGAKEEGKRGDCTFNNTITTTKTTGVAIQKLKYRNHTKIEIVQRSSSFLDWLVALKPSGMRTKGTEPGTLETNVSEQEGIRYVSLSSLETSCPGLCVLVKFKTAKEEENNNKNQISIRNFVTVLVHGELLPVDVWFPFRTGVQMVVEAKWGQKKMNKKRKQIISKSESESSSLKIEEQKHQKKVVYTSIDITPKESTTMAVQEYPDKQNNNNNNNNNNCKEPQRKNTTTKTTTLSTVEVITSEPSSGSICNFFRHEGYPVVGDKFCKQEYSNLKRSIPHFWERFLHSGGTSSSSDGKKH
ncbi:hypothetical protein FRACYDRAFT_232648 [Fragilariopsis cylindrus CCMP1102]|uniref:25S rRNA (uridine-N(3))-methyltransferase BMT5-like domain-containing protein n=1 Tax=Fragilariopsis cylindrus CCMP1102 TaxID=635003 RepID=A0A1E7FWE9_9STRA|nr:hypothetical protein FRACYDRAFT_232648 [Fragilariopsis cylindrus CCMP1102]|eukprot:OEU22491.1 hypothetical protein FRACYDRAFT_232648 [Fragilariopsis cylindrus CCMP1102]